MAVLLLGALPLTAAAFDYGPNQPLLASNDSNSPQLPGAQVRAAVAGEMPKADAGDTAEANADDNAFPNPVTTQTHQAMPQGPGPASPRSHGPSASNKAQQHPASSAAAGAVPSAPSWQSLLPGSIQ
jgi:hypothetical protein